MLIVIGGPTAVGKTDLAVKLAKRINGEIISADSMQIYRGFDIGTAKVTNEEMQGVKHYMIDCVDGNQSFTVSNYKDSVKPIIDDILSRGKVPILVGGTGLYIDAVLHPYQFGAFSPKIREKYNKLASEISPESLHKLLQDKSPELANKIHPNNVKRVIRALEILESGADYTSDKSINEYEYLYIVLSMEREKLYKKVDARVDNMISNGLMQEVDRLRANISWESQAMQAIGYKEWQDYFDKKATLGETIDKIKLNSRHYVKKQLTWFRAKKEAVWMDAEDSEAVIKYVEDYLKNTNTNLVNH